MRVLEWRATACSDLFAVIDYISDDNPDVAQLLKNEIEAKSTQLLEHPQIYKPGRVSGTREMVIRKNYIVIYIEDTQTVTILRVLHSAQQWP